MEDQTTHSLLQELLDDSLEGILIYDREGYITYANRTAITLAGTNPIGEMGAKYVHPEDREPAYQAFLELGANPSRTVELEQRIITEQGEIRWIKARLHNRFSSEAIRGIVSYFTDISEYKDVEEQLEHSQRRETLGDILGYLAHDLSNMLGIVMGNADLLELRDLDQESSIYINGINRAAEKSATLVRRLLTYSCKQPVKREGFELSRLIQKHIVEQQSMRPPNISIEFNDCERKCVILADQTQLHQILLNLSNNAQHAIKGTGLIRISLDIVDLSTVDPPEGLEISTNEVVRLIHADTGSGITPENQKKVFEPFFSTKKGRGGSGLGLSVVNSIVSQSGGFIKMYSEVGSGTEFHIFFPRYFGEYGPIFESQSAELAFGRGSIVIVDEEVGIRDFMCRSLSHLGYEVQSASNFGDGVNILQKMPARPDLLIADSTVIGDDGETVASLFRARYEDLPILFISGFVDGDEEGELLENAEFLPKPFGIKTLSDRVDAMLRKNGSP